MPRTPRLTSSMLVALLTVSACATGDIPEPGEDDGVEMGAEVDMELLDAGADDQDADVVEPADMTQPDLAADMPVVEDTPPDLSGPCAMCAPNEICIEDTCLDACAPAQAECGGLVWSGQDVSCGTCMGEEVCVANQCAASSGWHRVDGGTDYTCGVRADGTTRCWGGDGFGQLGDGTALETRALPVLVSGVTGLVELDVFARHTCARTTDGTAWCWGQNTSGQLGDGTMTNRPTPVVLTDPSKVAQIEAGALHSCAVLENGTAECWGFNRQGQLGDGTADSSETPRGVRQLTGIVDLDVGSAHTCAVLRSGGVSCWGYNGLSSSMNLGRLGTGETTSRTVPTGVLDLEGVRDVATGEAHTCAVLESGEVWCWGDNDSGQLGDGSTTDTLRPVKVFGLTNAVAIAAGKAHTCAVDASRRVRCWGDNTLGQLGDVSFVSRDTPQLVPNLEEVLVVGVGAQHTCATTKEARLFCWGAGVAGQLGDGSSTNRNLPTRVQ